MMATQSFPVPRSVILVSPDGVARERLKSLLANMRWRVQEATSGAEALGIMDDLVPEAVMLDGWLPDLEVNDFRNHLHKLYPQTDLLNLDGTDGRNGHRSPRRNELLHALREMQDSTVVDSMAWHTAVPATGDVLQMPSPASKPQLEQTSPVSLLPGMIGESEPMKELARLVRLVAPTTASVLIEGETGTGKELVAHAIHQLSDRLARPFVVLNCAAIPEQLLEAELFGHTRGAFTGAVQSRTGRIEAAHGGTLFLDEIGEMPLPLQAKMLRFLENGEIQRVGDNDVMRVDVRVVAATHQPLEQRAVEGKFRLDLYHRLAVFPIQVPSLRSRKEDLPMLVSFMLERFGTTAPIKRIDLEALDMLHHHEWPGNVRELGHVLHRAVILSAEISEIKPDAIRIRSAHS